MAEQDQQMTDGVRPQASASGSGVMAAAEGWQ